MKACDLIYNHMNMHSIHIVRAKCTPERDGKPGLVKIEVCCKTLASEKNSLDIRRSGLCIGGFTQPDSLKKLLEDLKSQDDGLLDR